MKFLEYFLQSFIDNVSKIDTVVALIVGYFLARSQFKFQSTHQRRMLIIEEAYEKIKITNKAYSFLNRPLKMTGEDLKDEEAGKDFVDKANQMVSFLDAKKLFFSDKEKKHIDAINKLFHESWGEYTERRIISNNPTLRDPKREREIWSKNWKDANEEIPKLIEALEDTFRKALGLKNYMYILWLKLKHFIAYMNLWKF